MEEKCFTVDELAELFKLSRYTIIRRFENEAGVVNWGSPRHNKV
jgi:hypothetical protein